MSHSYDVSPHEFEPIAPPPPHVSITPDGCSDAANMFQTVCRNLSKDKTI